jgi:menaquinone-dependent protoporphyrinogen oxidase
MKILVVYATKSGCTEDVARRIGAGLRKLGADVKVMPFSAKPDPAGWDAIIAGSGVRAGKWHHEAPAWIRKHADVLKRKPLALFTVCMTMQRGQQKAPEVLAYTKPLIQQTGITPVGIGLFAGWFLPEKFGAFERFILKMTKAPQGDFRDLAAIDAWTLDTAPRIGLPINVGEIEVARGDGPDIEIL